MKLSSLQLLMNRKRQGKRSYFVLSRSTKALSDLPENTWKMESASKKVFCSKETCMEVIHEHFHESCWDSCNWEWLNCALEVLQENHIYPPYFSAAVQELLQMVRGKSRNVLKLCLNISTQTTWALVWYILYTIKQ